MLVAIGGPILVVRSLGILIPAGMAADNATRMYLAGVGPFPKRPVPVAQNLQDRKLQRQGQAMSPHSHTVTTDQAGLTLAACVRKLLPDQSWERVRRIIGSRRVKLAGEHCLDPARRLKEGDVIELSSRSAALAVVAPALCIRHVDPHVVVVEKPSGICTVRHPTERDWPERRKALSPTLEEIVPRLITRTRPRNGTMPLPRLRIVQRLDKETSGLVVFARTVAAERGLGGQFRAHTVIRRYLAIVPGRPPAQRIETHLVRDRGDGRRGSTRTAGLGKPAITHVEIVERLPGYTLLSCRLETGRTHQIRIHLSELGYPVCGERVYNRRAHGEVIPDRSQAPRLALHAAELGFVHPVTGLTLHWTMPLPPDLERLLNSLRSENPPAINPIGRAGHGNQVD